ncbi:MAG: electron transfer flavoprotein beta subunit/FixA family protein, partial [Chloroflexota bacterium]|nr:electron transfer flavoprotein beta subunit/FixA family protein [Chloroflexota bacterium]
PDAVQETIRKALSMGADRGIQLKTAAVPFDPFPIARALADELERDTYDLVLFGKMSIDSANQAVGPMTAELLGLPCVTAVSKLDIADGRGTAERAVEGAVEVVEFPLPAALTIDEGLNTARYPSLKGIMAAKKKPLDVRPVTLAPETVAIHRMELPPERPAGRIIGQGAGAVPELIRLLRTEAKVL